MEKKTTPQQMVLKRLKSEPTRNLLCGHHTRDRSNSWGPGPTVCWAQCRARV